MANKFLEGLLGGYVGYKQGEERRKREDRQDALYGAIVGNMKGNKSKTPGAGAGTGPEPTTSNTDFGKTFEQSPYDYEGADAIGGDAMANGGMVKPMPKQHDRFGWQKQSFKKGTLSPEEEMAAHMLVIEASLKKGRRK